LGLT